MKIKVIPDKGSPCIACINPDINVHCTILTRNLPVTTKLFCHYTQFLDYIFNQLQTSQILLTFCKTG